jgi:hypothetical protein
MIPCESCQHQEQLEEAKVKLAHDIRRHEVGNSLVRRLTDEAVLAGAPIHRDVLNRDIEAINDQETTVAFAKIEAEEIGEMDCSAANCDLAAVCARAVYADRLRARMYRAR